MTSKGVVILKAFTASNLRFNIMHDRNSSRSELPILPSDAIDFSTGGRIAGLNLQIGPDPV